MTDINSGGASLSGSSRTKMSKKEKRQEIFQSHKNKMLEGYSHNSFQPAQKKKARQPQKSNGTRERNLDEILDEISLNSSSKNLQVTPINELNLNKSKSGLISSIMNDKPIEMNIQDASLTINTKGAIGHDEIRLNLLDEENLNSIRAHDKDPQQLYELNKQQFEQENPYAESQEIDLRDFKDKREKRHRDRTRSKSRKQRRQASVESTISQDSKSRGSNDSRPRRRSNRVSAFEKYEEIRFACYEMEQKLKCLTQMFEGVQISGETAMVPTSVLSQIQNTSFELLNDFSNIQNQWTTHFDEQQQSNQRARSKNKQYKKKLINLENQSMQFIQDQKEFEMSLQNISKAHDQNKTQMGQFLDQIESQVSQLKNTRVGLNVKYEQKLDHAIKEMIQFYNNLENKGYADETDIDLEKVFFVMPAQEVKLNFQPFSGGSAEEERKEPEEQKQEEVDYVVNPVMVGAMNNQLESKFDQQYEDDFEGANVTLDMNTERLRQFPEEYEMLQHIEDNGQRILMKQVVFMKYERQLKKQAKLERKRLKAAQKQGQADQPVQQEPTQRSSKSSAYNCGAEEAHLGMGERHNETNITCGLSFQSQLPSMNTVEFQSAQKKFKPVDVKLDELLECEMDLALGMKTATQKSLIHQYEEDFKQKAIIRGQIKQEEKKLDYSSSIQSKISLPGKMSIGSRDSRVFHDQMLSKQYASNNSGGSKPNIFIADSQDCSVNSEHQQNHQGKKKQVFEHAIVPPLSVKSKQSLVFPAVNEQNSLILSHENSQIEKESPQLPNDSVNVSSSVASQYHRYLKQHDHIIEGSPYMRDDQKMSPSPQIKSSFVQSSPDSINGQFQDQELHQHQELMILQNEQYENQRRKLPLESIQERQSEFSQSMITHHNRINSHRSRATNNPNAGAETSGPNQYANGGNFPSGGHNRGTFSSIALPSARSDSNNQMSTNRRNSSCIQDNSLFEPKKSLSVLQQSRDAEDFIQKQQIENKILIDGSFSRNSRNRKNSQSNRDCEPNSNQESVQKLSRQPSAGKIESQNRQKFIQKFEQDISSIMIPPLGKSRQNEKQCNSSRKKAVANQGGLYHINLSHQNSQANLAIERDQLLQNNQYQPHSHRSNVNGGDSFRDRSYLDESPATFLRNRLDSKQSKDKDTIASKRSQIRESQHKAKAILHNLAEECESLENQFDSEVAHHFQSNMQTNQSGQFFIEEDDSLSQQQKLNSGIHSNLMHQMQSIPQSSVLSVHTNSRELPNQIFTSGSGKLNDLEAKVVEEVEEEQPKTLYRSNSECMLRDKEFYEMCDDEDEIAAYCKLAEQNILDSIYLRNLKNRSESPALNISHANKSSSQNQLVFMSQRTFNRICGKWNKGTDSQQTRTKGTIKRFNGDPTRLLASMNNGNGYGPQNIHTYLGTNLLTQSLDEGNADTLPMHQNIMLPTHQYNRRTLLMMQNLHNNYLYSANTGILFTMQRGWNSSNGQLESQIEGARTNPQIGFKNASIGQHHKDGSIKTLGGDPVNITNLLLGAKQQTTTEQINVGSITIIDDDGKFMIDRKLLIDSMHNRGPGGVRRFFHQSSTNRNINATAISGLSNFHDSHNLGILKNNPPKIQSRANSNEQNQQLQRQEEWDSDQVVEKRLQNQSTFENKAKINNLLAGLKSIQQKQVRAATEISTEKIVFKPQIQFKVNSQGEPPQSASLGSFNTVTAKSKNEQILQNMMKIQQIQSQKQKMNLSQSLKFDDFQQKSKSQPKNNNNIAHKKKQLQMQFQFLNNGEKLKVVTKKSNLEHSQKIVLSNQTVKNFNTIVDGHDQDVSGKAVTKKVSVKPKSIGSKNSFAIKKASYQSNMGVIVSARSNSNNTGKLNIKRKVVNQNQQLSQNIKLK